MNKKPSFCAFFKKYFVLEILIVFFIITFDLLLKAYSELNLKISVMPLIKGVVSLTYLENRGAAFGMLQNCQPFFIVLTVIAFGVFIWFIYRNRNGHILLKIAFSLILGGTAGNFIDRVKLGYVRDMIELEFVKFAVFNIADSALTVGVALFIIYYLFIYKEPVKEQSPKKENGSESDAIIDKEKDV